MAVGGWRFTGNDAQSRACGHNTHFSLGRIFAQHKERWTERLGGYHTLRATGITAYLGSRSTLGNAEVMAATKAPRTHQALRIETDFVFKTER
jgi:hypothetical protein